MPMKVLANFWLVCTTFGCSHTKQKNIKQKSCKLSGQQFKPSSTNWPAWPKTRIWQMPLQLPMAQKLCSLPESNCSWPKRNTSSPCPFRPNPIRNACHLRLERNGSRTNAERENPFGAHTQRERERKRATCWKISSVKIAYVSAFASAKCVCEEENNTKIPIQNLWLFPNGIKARNSRKVQHFAQSSIGDSSLGQTLFCDLFLHSRIILNFINILCF